MHRMNPDASAAAVAAAAVAAAAAVNAAVAELSSGLIYGAYTAANIDPML